MLQCVMLHYVYFVFFNIYFSYADDTQLCLFMKPDNINTFFKLLTYLKDIKAWMISILNLEVADLVVFAPNNVRNRYLL